MGGEGGEGGREEGWLTVLVERATKDVVTRSFSHWHYFTCKCVEGCDEY